MFDYTVNLQLTGEEVVFLNLMLERFGCSPKSLKRMRKFIGSDIADMIGALMNKLSVAVEKHAEYVKQQESKDV